MIQMHKYSKDSWSLKKIIHQESHSVLEKYELVNNQKIEFSLDECQITLLSRFEAKAFLNRYHYLGGERDCEFALGCFVETEGERSLASVAMFSRFDLLHLLDQTDFIKSDKTLVLSRLALLPTSPKNFGSKFLSLCIKWIKSNIKKYQNIITYLDKNVGFNGAQYKASNFRLIGYEKKSNYLFLNGTYITSRELIRLFGTANFVHLKSQLRGRIEKSSFELIPLEIYFISLTEKINIDSSRTFMCSPYKG